MCPAIQTRNVSDCLKKDLRCSRSSVYIFFSKSEMRQRRSLRAGDGVALS